MLGLICLPFVVALLTRILVDDMIALPLRQLFINKLGEQSWWTYLVHCPRCASVWIAFATAIPTGALMGLPLWLCVLLTLATAQLAPMILSFGDRIETGGS